MNLLPRRSWWFLIGMVAALGVLALNYEGVGVLHWRGVADYQRRGELNRALASSDLPPTLAITTLALGPLRGLVANGLWWRSVRLQDEGDYFEAIQLADWITALQPNLPGVWRYLAWNLSYNLSAATRSPPEQYKWLMQGVTLLRDRGLRYNPGDRGLQREIAATFYNKLCKNLPDNRYYKEQWARQMSGYLVHGDAAELAELAAAPATAEDLAGLPGTTALLQAAQVQGLSLLDWDQFNRARQATSPHRQLLENPVHAPALGTIRRYLVRTRLRQVEKLDPARMLQLDREYGPLDWRLGQAYVIYWTVPAPGGPEPTLNGLDQGLIGNALQNAFSEGRLVYRDDQHLILGNNLQLTGRVHRVLEAALHEHGSPEAQNRFRTFHEYAVVVLYNYGYFATSRDFFGELRAEGVWDANTPEISYEDFLRTRGLAMLDVEASANDSRSMVMAALMQAYQSLATGEDHRALGFERMARLIWDHHQRANAQTPVRLLPPFESLRQAAYTASLETLAPVFREALTRRQTATEPPVATLGTPLPELDLGGPHGHAVQAAPTPPSPPAPPP